MSPPATPSPTTPSKITYHLPPRSRPRPAGPPSIRVFLSFFFFPNEEGAPVLGVPSSFHTICGFSTAVCFSVSGVSSSSEPGYSRTSERRAVNASSGLITS